MKLAKYTDLCGILLIGSIKSFRDANKSLEYVNCGGVYTGTKSLRILRIAFKTFER